jgi:quercetin dioxygenase-like cupin family protein
MIDDDPAATDPSLYKVVLENDRVRVLEYRDEPGDRTHPHRHPDSVMVTLSAFHRRVTAGDRSVEVELSAGESRWLAAQEHMGENIGGTPTHSIFIELKEQPAPAGAPAAEPPLGPDAR